MAILVTGSSSGLGASLVRIFRTRGYQTCGVSRSKSPETDYVCDFTDHANLNSNFKLICQKYSAFDYVFLNAGILGDVDYAHNVSLENFTEVLKVNLFANKIILDCLLKSNIKIKCVIGISSGASKKNHAGWVSYCTSKSAFNSMISCYAKENISTHFINLAPGLIRTKMQDQIVKAPLEVFPSLNKFKSSYNSSPLSDDVANRIFESLNLMTRKTSGSFVDLKDLMGLRNLRNLNNK